jgi:hypothetical protein
MFRVDGRRVRERRQYYSSHRELEILSGRTGMYMHLLTLPAEAPPLRV